MDLSPACSGMGGVRLYGTPRMGPGWAPDGPPTAPSPKRLYSLAFLLPPLLQTSSPSGLDARVRQAPEFAHGTRISFIVLPRMNKQQAIRAPPVHRLEYPAEPNNYIVRCSAVIQRGPFTIGISDTSENCFDPEEVANAACSIGVTVLTPLG